jgi:hypothetical protein
VDDCWGERELAKLLHRRGHHGLAEALLSAALIVYKPRRPRKPKPKKRK